MFVLFQLNRAEMARVGIVQQVWCVCVCACVRACKRERERERVGEKFPAERVQAYIHADISKREPITCVHMIQTCTHKYMHKHITCACMHTHMQITETNTN